MDTEAISSCVGPLSKEYLTKLPHHVTPCMNLHRIFPRIEDQDDVARFLNKPFPYSSSVPVPLTPLAESSRSILNGLDPTTCLIRDKEKWQAKKDKIVTTVRNDRRSIREKQIKKMSKAQIGSRVEVPQGVALLAQHLDKDPDPHFSGVYNWYYTGGTLAAFSQDDDHYLLHGAHSQLSCSKVVGGWSPSTSAVDLDSNETIFQITTNSNGAAVRQKSTVSVFAVLDLTDVDMGLQLTKVHTISDEKHRFLNVALQNDTIEKYSTVSIDGVIRLWDTEYANMQQKSKYSVEPGDGVTVTDNWSCLRYLDKHTLLWVNRCCLHIFDIRAGLRENQLAWCPRNLAETCEQLSYVVPSCLRDQVVYPATSHQVFSLDLRFGFCQRWTHTMAAPPLMGFAQTMGQNQEVICLGSQIMSDSVVLVNEWQGENPVSTYKPTSLSPPARGLLQARQRGYCLDPALTQRCVQSMIGLSCLPADNCLQIVRQSATADIFIQQLTTSETDTTQLTDWELEAFSEWCKPTLSLQRSLTTLTVTDVVDFTPVFKVLTNTSIPTSNSVMKTEEDGVPGWQMSKNYLENCVDMLAPKMLAVWDVEDEDEWAVEVEEAETLVEQDPAEKVLNWLDASTPAEGRDITTVTHPKQVVTSTPFLYPSDQQDTSPLPSPERKFWKCELSQLTPSDRRACSPPSSGSTGHKRKRQKLCFDSVLTTPVKQTTSAKKLPSSAKKKFIPGMPDKSRPLDEPIWADVELASASATTIPEAELLWSEKYDSSQGSTKSQSPPERKIAAVGAPLEMECLYRKNSVLFSSSSESDGVIVVINNINVSNVFSPSYSLPSTHSSTDTGFCSPSLNSITYGGPSVTDYCSASALDNSSHCGVCGLLPADTCVMHHHQRHLNFCLGCATQCFQNSAICPLCPQRIVYIYKYDNI